MSTKYDALTLIHHLLSGKHRQLPQMFTLIVLFLSLSWLLCAYCSS